jgi:toluene monooxygenase system ferredoxin subunit
MKVKVCNEDDLLDGEKIGFTINKTRVLLLRLDGIYFAYEDKCPHQGVPMSEGYLQEYTLTCMAHQWCFDAKTGAGINPESAALKKILVIEENKEVFINLDAATEPKDRRYE